MTSAAGRDGAQPLFVENVARIAHEVNREWCRAIGDDSQPSWEDAPEWQRSSAINGVRFHATHPDATAEASHESWLKEKTANGWTYGETKDPEKKTHPCCRPYAELPVEQRAKDHLFRAVVRMARSLEPGCESW